MGQRSGSGPMISAIHAGSSGMQLNLVPRVFHLTMGDPGNEVGFSPGREQSAMFLGKRLHSRSQFLSPPRYTGEFNAGG